ncbi:hypothetical protein FJQ98_17415 [Lysinibacillus agricola]|uniref:DUF3592 domain-containing protein n=1 Tax=Lysinibacillus agricola TaxID=2590012 RepID=A0ABX7AMP6_9BACI|nr:MULTISPECIES: hypothetical protein [Lysinibacillus]KOS62201.1 hypothetical protein AN161_14055 [Lysinibacillus sp. FJAT-14222]QQP11009.1 hypothetical protein FJQ98_17415 [Lysinibacillus agricola]
MKRKTLLSLLLIFMISSSVQALSWAYPFVVWKEKVYEIKQEEFIENSKIGQIIGEVKTKPNGMTGKYYGDASNYYPKGTKYYEIKGTSTSTAIAVKEANQWVKAIYVHKAPFHIMNVISNIYFISVAVIMALIVIGVMFRAKKSKNQ